MFDRFLLLLGPLAMAATFALMWHKVEPFATFFYLCAWYGLIFSLDQCIRALQGRSLIARCGPGFFLLLFWSAVTWFFFELCNFRLQNWYYIFIEEHPFLQYAGTFAAFATVFPGIFWIERCLAARGVAQSVRGRPLRLSGAQLYLLQADGLLFLLLPLLFPRYFFPLVWGALILLIAPLNYRRNVDGLLRQLERGEYGPTLRLLLAGLIAGLCWEFFNFWARAKWIYTVPFFEELKLFEMPLAGFVGFAPFAVECAEVYRFLVWHCLAPPFGAYIDQKPRAGSLPAKAGIILLAFLFACGVNYYLVRLTVTSTTPRIERMESLDRDTRAWLHQRGVEYLTALEGWGSEKLWQDVQEELDEEQYAQLKRLSRLYLHQGIGTEYGNLLVRAGIGSVEELGSLSAEEVLDRLQDVARGEKLPTPARVRVWIRRGQ